MKESGKEAREREKKRKQASKVRYPPPQKLKKEVKKRCSKKVWMLLDKTKAAENSGDVPFAKCLANKNDYNCLCSN